MTTMDESVYNQQSQSALVIHHAPTVSQQLPVGNATGTRVVRDTENSTANQSKVIQCYNCKGDDHTTRHCTQPKRAQNLAWFTKKMLLVQVQEAGIALSEEQLAFLADTREKVDSSFDAYTLTTNAIFQTYGINSYDSECDKLPVAQATFMANLSDYGSNILSE
ncbi:integrase, catalytic region, zinc finger, CCHC-type containing protein, partial [Tanacetum coccineum]